jgi:hypothetical protein
VILRCTAKLLALLGAKRERMTLVSDDDWYANLLWIERRKCILLTHSGTLFSVFAPDVRKSDLVPIGSFAIPAIERALVAEGLPKETFGHLDPADVRVASTASRSILAFMNEMAHSLTYAVAETGVRDCDVAQVNRSLQRELHRTGAGEMGYERPIDAVRASIATPRRSG